MKLVVPYVPLYRLIKRDYECSRPWRLTEQWSVCTEGFNCLSWLPELLCKRRIYSISCESNGGVDVRWPPSQITHSISSFHLQLESLSHRVIVLQRMRCNWALFMPMCRPASQLYVGLATIDVVTWHTCCACRKCSSVLVKVDRAV